MAWLLSKALIDRYANSPCLQEPAAGYSPDVSLAGELYVPSSSTSTPPACSWQGKTTGASIRFRSGMTFALSTADRGEDVLKSCRGAFPVRTFQPQERAPESTASDPGCGPKWRESLAKYDPASRSWKTRQCLLVGGLGEFSATWPKWGTTRGGAAYRLPTPSGLLAIRVYITSAKESGLSLPTPCKGDADRGDCPSERRRRSPSLVSAVKIVTPHGLSNNQGQGGGEFDKAVRSMATPTATDARKWNAKTKAQRKAQGSSVRICNEDRGDGLPIGGQLNPTWVEWLMGWPIGWTDLEPLATDKFQAWLRSHGES